METNPRIRFDLEKLSYPTVMSAFQATTSGRLAPLATLVDEDADLDSKVTHFNKAVTDTAAELLGKQSQKRKPWVTPEILSLLLKDLISDFYLTSLQLVLCRVAAVKRLPVHQP